VITWKDFVFDDVMGPILMDFESCRGTRLGSPSVMEDANGIIQETGQEQRPARMVGLSNLDSKAQSHMEVSRGHRASEIPRLRGEA
jgi:hypothetical protein